MKKIYFYLLVLVLVALACEYDGFIRGFNQGEKETNSWWISKKSLYYDTSEVIKKQIKNNHNFI